MSAPIASNSVRAGSRMICRVRDSGNSPSRRNSIISTRMTPKIRKFHDGKSMFVWNWLLYQSPNWDSPRRLIHATNSAPTITPQTLPMPPSTTMSRIVIELAKLKFGDAPPTATA